MGDTLASPDGVGPGNRVRLKYQGELGSPVLTLDVWHPDEWTAHLEQPIGQVWWSGECVSRTVVELPDGRAEIFAGPVSPTAGCSGDDEPTGFIAHVYLEGAVVAVNAPTCLSCTPQPESISELRSSTGMELVTRSLVLR